MTHDEMTARKAVLEGWLRVRENRDGYASNVREIKAEIERLSKELTLADG